MRLKIEFHKDHDVYAYHTDYYSWYRAEQQTNLGWRCVAQENTSDELMKKIDPQHLEVLGGYLFIYEKQIYFWKVSGNELTEIDYKDIEVEFIEPLQDKVKKFKRQTEKKINQVRDIVFRCATKG